MAILHLTHDVTVRNERKAMTLEAAATKGFSSVDREYAHSLVTNVTFSWRHWRTKPDLICHKPIFSTSLREASSCRVFNKLAISICFSASEFSVFSSIAPVLHCLFSTVSFSRLSSDPRSVRVLVHGTFAVLPSTASACLLTWT